MDKSNAPSFFTNSDKRGLISMTHMVLESAFRQLQVHLDDIVATFIDGVRLNAWNLASHHC